MTAISVDEFLTNPVNYLKLAYTTELIIQDLNGKRLSLREEPEERLPGVDYSVISPEDLEDHKRAMEEMAKGLYYSKFPDETVEEFFDRIDSDPEKWLECNLHKERFS